MLRRIDVPTDIRLYRLHLTLQAALGWENSHLYEFKAGGSRWGMPDPDFDGGPRDARKARLIDILDGTTTGGPFKYVYDFGDNWQHTVTVDQVTDAAPGVLYPVLVEARGRCPPEDVGGPFSYPDFLEAIADPEHEQHAEMIAWVGEAFDPEVADVNALTAAVATLVKRWTRTTRASASAFRAKRAR